MTPEFQTGCDGVIRLLGCGDWPTMPLMKCLGGDVNHEWHVAINHHSTAQMEAKQEWPGWMYDAGGV